MEASDISGAIKSIKARIYLSDELIERVYEVELDDTVLLQHVKDCEDAYVYDHDDLGDGEIEITIRAPKPTGDGTYSQDALIAVCDEYIRDVWGWDQFMCSLRKNIEEVRRGVFEIETIPY